MSVYGAEAVEGGAPLETGRVARAALQPVHGARATVWNYSRKSQSQTHARPDSSSGRHDSVLVTWAKAANGRRSTAAWRLDVISRSSSRGRWCFTHCRGRQKHHVSMTHTLTPYIHDWPKLKLTTISHYKGANETTFVEKLDIVLYSIL